MTELLYKELTGTIIGVYWEVYNGMSRVYTEFIYEQAMVDELRRRGVPCQRQPEHEICYYANAVYHELQLRGFEVLPRHEYQVFYSGRPVGATKFNHLQVGSSLLVFPIAIQDMGLLHIKDCRSWMRYLGTPLATVADFYPARLDWMVLRV